MPYLSLGPATGVAQIGLSLRVLHIGSSRIQIREEENGSSAVHYDLLSGRLLVDGQPLGRLTSQYEKHDSYERLFGDSTIEVMPSNAAGLLYSAKTPYLGYSLQFGMAVGPSSSANDLLVQASEGSPGKIL